MKLNIYVLLLIFLVILMYFQPSFLGNLCTNCFGKATLILLIVFLAIQDIGLAILASVVLISSMHLVSREGFKEGNTEIPGECRGVESQGTNVTKLAYDKNKCTQYGTCHVNSTTLEEALKFGVDKNACENDGICTDSNGNKDTSLNTESECLDSNGTCNDSNNDVDTSLSNKIECIEAGTCSNGTDTKEKDCTDNSGIWTLSNNTWSPTNTWDKYHWKPYTWTTSTQPDLACDAYQEHVNNENAHNTHSHASQFTNMRSGFRNRKGGKEGFMVSSSELISFEDSKIRGKDSNIYPVSRSNVQNKGLFSGFNLF